MYPLAVKEKHNLDGRGYREHEVYYVAPSDDGYWDAVTDIPCPVPGCDQTVAWYEAGYVPGYRVCARSAGSDAYDTASIRHRFLAGGSVTAPTLIRDHKNEHNH